MLEKKKKEEEEEEEALFLCGWCLDLVLCVLLQVLG